MQVARLEENGHAGLYVYVHGDYFLLRDGRGTPVDLPGAMAAEGRLKEWAADAIKGMPARDYRFLPAVPAGGKLILAGANYKKHLMEIGLPFSEVPVLFSKFGNALAAHGEEIPLPAGTHQIDYEAELVLVIGRRGKGIAREDALSHVFGYTCGNDLSARDLQFLTSQWLIGKTADGFAPAGPHIRLLEGVDPDDLRILLRLNGETRQQASTADMIFDCAALISYISRTITLQPGDLIFTGTPGGVIQGYPEGERRWLKDGDVVEVEIEGLPPLRNTLKSR